MPTSINHARTLKQVRRTTMKFFSDMLPMRLQMFAEDTGGDSGSASTQNDDQNDDSNHQDSTNNDSSNDDSSKGSNDHSGNSSSVKKVTMTQDKLDKMLAEREDRARREAVKKSKSEAEKYRGLSDMQKLQKQLSDLSDVVNKQNKELKESKAQQERTAMEREVDKTLRAKGIVLNPDEIDFYVGETAEETNAKVEKAIKMFGRFNTNQKKGNLQDDKSNNTIDNGKASNRTKLNLSNSENQRREQLAKTFGLKK